MPGPREIDRQFMSYSRCSTEGPVESFLRVGASLPEERCCNTNSHRTQSRPTEVETVMAELKCFSILSICRSIFYCIDVANFRLTPETKTLRDMNSGGVIL